MACPSQLGRRLVVQEELAPEHDAKQLAYFDLVAMKELGLR